MGHTVAYHLKYKHVGLMKFHIDDIVPAHDSEAEYLRQRRAESARKALLRLAREPAEDSLILDAAVSEDAQVLWHPESDEEDLLPIFSADTGKIHAREPPHGYLGRISRLRVGTPQEAFSIYCARHGCSFMSKLARCPPHEHVLEWLRAGCDIEQGRTPALKGSPRRLWRPG